MKSAFVFLCLFVLAAPLHAFDFAGHPFFKHLIGEWEAAGELKTQDGNTVTITEKWTGKADAADSFYIEGSRTINGDTQTFKWTVTHNAATNGFDSELSGSDGQTIRFEGSLSEPDLVMNMKAITGSGDGSITLQDSFTDDKKETLQTKITFSGDQGQTNLEGTLIHKRLKAP